MEVLLCLLVLFVSSSVLLCLAPEKKQAANELASGIDRLLPQTQCRACGYDGCRPYAEAIAAGSADLNQCPPGGQSTIDAIAALTGQAPKALNLAEALACPEQVARIDEALCIGCVKCALACPVDAIIGAPKQMHTIMAGACTGCELCLPPCPVDCITMTARADSQARWQWAKPGQAVIITS